MSRTQARAAASGPWAPSVDDVFAVLYRLRDAVRPALSEAELAYHLTHGGPA